MPHLARLSKGPGGAAGPGGGARGDRILTAQLLRTHSARHRLKGEIAVRGDGHVACTNPAGMRIAIAVLLTIHGLIHLLGFVQPWKLAKVEALSGRTLVPLSEAAGRVVGILWLLAAMLLLAASASRLAECRAWWALGALGIALSQALIILQWSDAKAGTVANLLLVLPVAVAAATARFQDASDEQVRALLVRAHGVAAEVLTAADVAPLPPPVRRWLFASGAIGQPRARSVRLIQRGELRTGPDRPFSPAAAKQYFTVDEPGFVWTVEVTLFGFVPFVGRDSYVDGRGRMLIRAGGLVTVADGTGEKFDQGALLRYLGEMVWFPSGALAPGITWEPIDDRRARGTLSLRGVAGSAVFEFDEQGRFKELRANRYFGDQALEDWVVGATEWRVVRGISLPVRGNVTWKLAAGDLEYYRWEVQDVEANRPEPW